MRQLHIREPWADLAYTSDQQMIEDLVSRIQILESKIQELEMRVAEQSVDNEIRENIPVGV